MILRRTHEMTGGGDLESWRGPADTGNATQREDASGGLRSMPSAWPCSAWNGRQEVALDGRRVFVDDDTWMTVPACPANVRIRGARSPCPDDPVPARHAGRDARRVDHARRSLAGERRGRAVRGAALHAAPLYARSRVTPVLLFIRRHCEMGLDDALWYEEQFAFLLERLLMRHRQVVARAHSVPVSPGGNPPRDPAARLLATDFIHSNYDKPLMLGDMARAAFLSRHHFLRLFKRIHDVTPHEYCSASARLSPRACCEARWRSRTSSSRSVRLALDAVPRCAFHGVTPRECRRAPDGLAFMGGMANAG